MTGGMLESSEKGREEYPKLETGEKMVRFGIRALIARISRGRHAASSTLMVYSYSPPFESAKLKVSDIHSLQSVHSSHTPFLSLTFEDSYEVSGNKDGAPGAFHHSPGYYPRVAYRANQYRAAVVFLHGEVWPCAVRPRILPPLLNLYMEVVPAADAMRRIAVSLIPPSTR